MERSVHCIYRGYIIPVANVSGCPSAVDLTRTPLFFAGDTPNGSRFTGSLGPTARRLRASASICPRCSVASISTLLLRRSTFTPAARFLSGATCSLATSRDISHWWDEPAICLIITRDGSLRSVNSSPAAVSTRTPAIDEGEGTGSWMIRSRAKRLAFSEAASPH